MVRHEVITDSLTWGFDITQDENTHIFTITTDNNPSGGNIQSSFNSQRIPITRAVLLDDSWVPRGKIENVRSNWKQTNGKWNTDFHMRNDTLFEAWFINASLLSANNRNVNTNVFILFDLYRHELLLSGLPLIEYHGYRIDESSSGSDITIEAHATSYYERFSAANNREVVEILTGDGETHTGYGFNRPPERNGDNDRFNVPRPPSRTRLKSDHITYYTADLDGSNIGETTKTLVNNRYNVDIDINRPNAPNTCLLYTSPSPRDS